MSDNIQYLSFSNKVKVEVPQSSLTLQPHGLYSAWNAPDQNTAVGSLSLLQGTFPTQGSNPGLPRCRQILYQLSHKGSPGILEWVAFSFSRASSQPSDQTQVSHVAGRFFTSWATRILYQLSQKGSPLQGMTVIEILFEFERYSG